MIHDGSRLYPEGAAGGWVDAFFGEGGEWEGEGC